MSEAVSVPAGRRAPLVPPPGCGGSSGSRTPAPPGWRTTPCPRQSRHRWTNAGYESGRLSPRCGLGRGGEEPANQKTAASARDSLHHCNQSINQSATDPIGVQHSPHPFTPTAPLPHLPLPLPPPHLLLTDTLLWPSPILTHSISFSPTPFPISPPSPTASHSPPPVTLPTPPATPPSPRISVGGAR